MIIRANTLSSPKATRNVFFDNITYYSENRTKDTKSKLWKLKPQNKTNKFTFKFNAINCKKLYTIRIMLRARTISPSSSDKRPSRSKALNPLFALVSACTG